MNNDEITLKTDSNIINIEGNIQNNDDEEEKNSNNEEKILTEEEIRLGSKPALITLIILSIGPLLSQFTGALYGIVDTWWVSKAIGNVGMTAISTYNNFDVISRGFGTFLSVAASSIISSLFGEGDTLLAGQLLVDLIRISFIFALIIPLLFVPLTRPVAIWFGADTFIVELGREYVLPLLYCGFVPCLYLLACGCLQSEGRSWYFSFTQITSCLLNMLIFDPLFLFGFKLGIKGAAWATVLAELLPAIFIFYQYFTGKLGIKPKFSYFLKPFSPIIMKALGVGFSQFIFMLSLSIPGIFMRKFLGLTCSSPSVYNDVMAASNVLIKFYQIVYSVGSSLVLGFIPSAGFAFGAKRFKRVLYLFIHGIWISIIWCLFSMIFSVGFPKLIGKIFSNSTSFLNWTEIILFNSSFFSFLTPIPLMVQALLQSLQNGTQATMLSIISQLIPLPLFSGILYIYNKNDPSKLFYAYSIQHIFSTIVASFFGYSKFKNLLNIIEINPLEEINEL